MKDFLLGLLTRRGWGSPTATVDEAIHAEKEADLLRSSDKINKAIHLYTKAAQIYFYNHRPSDFDRLMNLMQSLESNSSVVKHLVNVGMMHFAEGKRMDSKDRVDDAVVQFQLALRFAPDNPRIYNNLGFDYGLQGKMKEELDCYERAVELDPQHVQAQNNLVIAYIERDREDAARSFLKKYPNLTSSEIDIIISGHKKAIRENPNTNW